MPPEPVWCEADENQIRQVVWNLATNGLRAMPAGGRLRWRPRGSAEARRRRARGRGRGCGHPAGRARRASSSRSTARSNGHRPRARHRPPHRHRLRRRHPRDVDGRDVGPRCEVRLPQPPSSSDAGVPRTAGGRVTQPARSTRDPGRSDDRPSTRRGASGARRRRRAVDARDAEDRAAARRLSRCCVAEDGREADEHARTASPIDLLLSDIRMPDMQRRRRAACGQDVPTATSWRS